MRRLNWWTGRAVMAVVVLALVPVVAVAADPAPCPGGTTLHVVAHQDDDLLFLSPDLHTALQEWGCSWTVVLTAGDAGAGAAYWTSRELGIQAAYADLLGVPDVWDTTTAQLANHPVLTRTLRARPTVTVAFLRLPDGNMTGAGFAATGWQSLSKLWAGGIASMTPVDGGPPVSRSGLIAILAALIEQTGADLVRTQDLAADEDGFYDHRDHVDTARFVAAAAQATSREVTLVAYRDYGISSLPANLTPTQVAAKQRSFLVYAAFDPLACQTAAACAATEHGTWFARQYVSRWLLVGGAPPSSTTTTSTTTTTTTTTTVPPATTTTTTTVSPVTTTSTTVPWWDTTTTIPWWDTTTTTPAPEPPAPPPPPSDQPAAFPAPAPSVVAYWLGDAAGAIHPFGASGPVPSVPEAVVSMAARPDGGLWVLGASGVVHAVGGAPAHGGFTGLGPGERPVAIAASGSGYLLATNRGRVAGFGGAPVWGDAALLPLNGEIVALMATTSGNGYWLVGSDGGVFAFGDAEFRGSMGGIPLNGPVVGMAADPDGRGYWLFATDGGVFSFDAEFRGSDGGIPLNRPVIGGTSYGRGYLLVAEDGGVFVFADLPFLGSLGGRPPEAAVTAFAARAR